MGKTVTPLKKSSRLAKKLANKAVLEPSLGPSKIIKGATGSTMPEPQWQILKASFNEDQDIVDVEVEVDSHEFGSEKEDCPSDDQGTKPSQSQLTDIGSQDTTTPKCTKGRLRPRSCRMQSEEEMNYEDDQNATDEDCDSDDSSPSVKIKR